MTAHEGRTPSLSTRDQADAAAAETRIQLEQRVARGARGYERMAADAPQIYRDLRDAYEDACDEARARYEVATPRPQWVNGRSRWATCEHLQGGGPAPAHWNPVAWETLICTSCWEWADAGLLECGRCGRHDHNLTVIGIAAISDAANQAQIVVSLDLCGLIQMSCHALDLSGTCEVELTRDEAHVLAHALHDAVTWPDNTTIEHGHQQ